MRRLRAWKNLRTVHVVGANPPAQANKTGKKHRHLTAAAIAGALGPGLLTALAGMDAGGIATFSNAGASFGYDMLWSIPVMCLLLIVVQETSARMGCVTGKGFASLIREQFGVRKSALAMLALIISNTAVTLSEFAGIASGMQLFGVPAAISVPIAAIASWLLSMGGSYRRVERVLLAISCVFITYVVAAFLVAPNWQDVMLATVFPHPNLSASYVSLLVANIGTTISPYMIFMCESNVVEKAADADDIPLQRIDTVSGALVAQAIAWFIVVCTGSVLFPAGIAVNSAADAAQALVPLAGPYAEVLFGVGLVGASFLAACVLPTITSGAVCEAFGWERGQDRTWSEAPVYRGMITGITALSALVVLIPGIDLFSIMMIAQVVNGVLLPVLLVFMVRIASDRHVMGAYANGRLWKFLTWFIVVMVAVLAVVMFLSQLLGFA